jgi:hypothetical protein
MFGKCSQHFMRSKPSNHTKRAMAGLTNNLSFEFDMATVVASTMFLEKIFKTYIIFNIYRPRMSVFASFYVQINFITRDE